MTDTVTISKRTLNFPVCFNSSFLTTLQSTWQNYCMMKFKQNKQNKQSYSSSVTPKSLTRTTMTTEQDNLNCFLTSVIQGAMNMSSSSTTAAAATFSNPGTSVTPSSVIQWP